MPGREHARVDAGQIDDLAGVEERVDGGARRGVDARRLPPARGSGAGEHDRAAIEAVAQEAAVEIELRGIEIARLGAVDRHQRDPIEIAQLGVEATRGQRAAQTIAERSQREVARRVAEPHHRAGERRRGAAARPLGGRDQQQVAGALDEVVGGERGQPFDRRARRRAPRDVLQWRSRRQPRLFDQPRDRLRPPLLARSLPPAVHPQPELGARADVGLERRGVASGEPLDLVVALTLGQDRRVERHAIAAVRKRHAHHRHRGAAGHGREVRGQAAGPGVAAEERHQQRLRRAHPLIDGDSDRAALLEHLEHAGAGAAAVDLHVAVALAQLLEVSGDVGVVLRPRHDVELAQPPTERVAGELPAAVVAGEHEHSLAPGARGLEVLAADDLEAVGDLGAAPQRPHLLVVGLALDLKAQPRDALALGGVELRERAGEIVEGQASAPGEQVIGEPPTARPQARSARSGSRCVTPATRW